VYASRPNIAFHCCGYKGTQQRHAARRDASVDHANAVSYKLRSCLTLSTPSTKPLGATILAIAADR
jgi:hypothetical protein